MLSGRVPMIRRLTDALLDLIYPPRCPVCRAPAESQAEWCPVCRAQVFRPRACPLEPGGQGLDRLYVAVDYDHGVRKLLRDLKFRGARRVAPGLGRLAAEAASRWDFRECDAVVPVPLSPERRRERGFNQTEAIFREWVECSGLPWRHGLLVRIRPTLPQWELSRAERRKNIKGAFVVTRPEEIRGKHILLLDDIYTTGATAGECARALKAAGAARVTGFVLAGAG